MTYTSEERLEQIYNLISDEIAKGRDMLLSTARLLDKVLDLSLNKEEDMKEEQVENIESTQEIIISCDASIKNNPGGPASIGAIIRFPDTTSPLKITKLTPALTNNEAEYDAIYEGLTTLVNLHNRPKYPVVVRSDSQLIVKQLRKEYKINLPALQRRYDAIHELCAGLPVPVRIEWMPRNSTEDLKQANFQAQNALGVKLH